jgi:hypothetical protein
METLPAKTDKIFTHFLMKNNLTHTELCYLQKDPFANVSLAFDKDYDYYIFSNLELDESGYETIKEANDYHLLKDFREGNAWCEIYAKKKDFF